MENELTFGLGAHPSPTDHRDHRDKELAQASLIPSTFKVEWGPVPIRMQYKIGKCVAEAVTREVEKIFYKKTGVYIPLSDDFLYLVTKKYIDGNTAEGTSFRNVLKAAQKYGICRASVFSIPVDNSTFYAEYIQNISKIPDQAFLDAMDYKIGQYISIPIELSLLQAAIYKYDGLVARFDVGQEWWVEPINPLRRPKTVVSGHGVGLDGFNALIVSPKLQGDIANSWSVSWNKGGYADFVFEDYSPTEAWAITLDPVPTDNLVFSDILKSFIDLLKKIGSWTVTKLGLTIN